MLIFNIMNPVLTLLHLVTVLTPNTHLLPFWKLAAHVPSVSGVASWGIERQHALQSNPVDRNEPSWSLGRKTTLRQAMGPKFACTSMSEMHAPCNLQVTMASIPVPSAVTHVTALVPAPETRLSDVLYIHTTPYKPKSWLAALSSSNLLSSFPNLVHDITYGSPIGNPPPLIHSFLPANLPSALIHPDLIDAELLDEVAANHMSLFTLLEASSIFAGPFHSSPVGLVKKISGDGVWRMIRHLSKCNEDGNSTNGWLDSNEFPTTYFATSWVCQYVILSTVLH